MCLVELEEATRQRNIMSINSYFLRQSDIMPLKKNTVSNTTEESSRLTSEASTGAGAKANMS